MWADLWTRWPMRENWMTCPLPQLVMHILELVINHNQASHELNLESIDDIVPSWMKACNNFDSPSTSLGQAIGFDNICEYTDSLAPWIIN